MLAYNLEGDWWILEHTIYSSFLALTTKQSVLSDLHLQVVNFFGCVIIVLITNSNDYLNSLQDEMFQKFNFDTEWAVKLISRITNDEDIPIEGHTIVKQVWFNVVVHIFVLVTPPPSISFLHWYTFVWVRISNPSTIGFQLLSLQINAEKYFFGIRKSLVEFDEVLEVSSNLLAFTIFHSLNFLYLLNILVGRQKLSPDLHLYLNTGVW